MDPTTSEIPREEVHIRTRVFAYDDNTETELPSNFSNPGSVISDSAESESEEERMPFSQFDSETAGKDTYHHVVSVAKQNEYEISQKSLDKMQLMNSTTTCEDETNLHTVLGCDWPPKNTQPQQLISKGEINTKLAISSEKHEKLWDRALKFGTGIVKTFTWFSILQTSKAPLNGESSKLAWSRTRAANEKGRRNPILITASKKAERAEKQLKAKRLLKVHFNLPKASTSRRIIAQAVDPKSPLIHRWRLIMLLPLAYELWAFPYRLALGAPSTRSNVFAADLACDLIFLIDIFVALFTAVPADRVGDPAITSFPAIARRYFGTVFPMQFLPCTLYWITTPICAHYLALLCPDFSEARRGGEVPGGQNPWDSEYLGGGAAAGAAAGAAVSVWECVVGNSRAWPVWVWWLSTLPRVLPRALRLAAYFKAMESDLVRSSDPRIHIACLALYNIITNDCCTSDLHVTTKCNTLDI